MPILIPVLLSYLLLLASTRAQVTAPNCTNSNLAWVGFLCAYSRFESITTRLSHRAGVLIHSHSIRSNKVRVWSQGSWRQYAPMAVSTCTLLAHRVRSYGHVAATSIPALQPGNSYSGPSGPDDNDHCKCNTVLYNLISACDACQREQWIPCVHLLLFSLGF